MFPATGGISAECFQVLVEFVKFFSRYWKFHQQYVFRCWCSLWGRFTKSFQTLVKFLQNVSRLFSLSLGLCSHGLCNICSTQALPSHPKGLYAKSKAPRWREGEGTKQWRKEMGGEGWWVLLPQPGFKPAACQFQYLNHSDRPPLWSGRGPCCHF